jgi:hypothetical protein
VFDEQRKNTKKEQEERKEEKKASRAPLFSLFDSSGMFHSDDERNRNVDPYHESWQSCASTTTTTTTADKRNAAYTFELGQCSTWDFDPFGFDFDGDFGGGGNSITPSQSNINSTTFNLGESQYSTTFHPEDKWPI